MTAAAPHPSRGNSRHAIPQPRDTKLVLVDDSALFRNGLANLLQLAGFDVVATVLTGEPACRPRRRPARRRHHGYPHAPHPHRRRHHLRPGHPRLPPHVGVLVLSTYVDGTGPEPVRQRLGRTRIPP